MSTNTQTAPMTVEQLQSLMRQSELADELLAIIESECSSLALDDERDRAQLALVLARHLSGA